ncbi:hypothetical protein ND16A_3613 [Thalassotalea sp. ND16A]|nr:hypothetical protein ND16A_3613 [Thalassotalea sp. ND16A]
MYIKFVDNSPHFEESIRILKRRYGTTAAATAVRFSVLEFSRSNFDYEALLEVNTLQKREIEHLKEVIERLLGTK